MVLEASIKDSLWKCPLCGKIISSVVGVGTQYHCPGIDGGLQSTQSRRFRNTAYDGLDEPHHYRTCDFLKEKQNALKVEAD